MIFYCTPSPMDGKIIPNFRGGILKARPTTTPVKCSIECRSHNKYKKEEHLIKQRTRQMPTVLVTSRKNESISRLAIQHLELPH